MLKLFEDDFGKDESPEDDTEITTTILYFSENELAEFKRNAKQAMRIIYGSEASKKGNISDVLLHVLKKFNDENAKDKEGSE